MTYPQTLPTPGVSQLASRYALDVNTGSSGSPTWVTVFGVFDFKPNEDLQNIDNSDFESGFLVTQLPVGKTVTVTASLRDKLYGGVQDPGQAALQAAAESTPPAMIQVRWYDRYGNGNGKSAWAYVQWQEQGGDARTQSTTVATMLVQSLNSITNPATTTSKPVISSVAPSGAGTGKIVVIIGSYFGGVTAVKFGATPATDFVVESSNRMLAALPSGSAGAANVTITNAVGVSDAFNYTRAI